MAVNWLIASSNLFGAVPLSHTIRDKKFIESLLLGGLMAVSSLMHISETKHQLVPPLFQNYSSLFLNIDRGLSYIIPILYYKKIYNNLSNIWPLGLIGIVCLGIGEIKTKNFNFNRIIYPILHIIWHFCVYKIIDQLV